MIQAADLLQKTSHHTDTALAEHQIDEYLAAVPDWALADGKLVRTFSFGNYYETLAFVNALAYLVAVVIASLNAWLLVQTVGGWLS